MSTDKESSAAGTDNRPPMLVEMIEGQGAATVQVTRDKTDEEFTKIENNRDLADIQATNILSQGLPRHVFNILNQTRNGKEIWDNVELLMKAAQLSNDAMLATMNQIVNLLSGFQKQFPPTSNQVRTSSNSRSHATVHDRQIVTKTIQRKAPGNVGNTGTRGTQSYRHVTDNKGKLVICYNCRGEGHVSRQFLDAEAEAFLANVECTSHYDQPLEITTTNIFEVIHEDAYDSDVDEGNHATAAFMANLSSTSETNGATTSHVNEEEHLDSDVESDFNDNTIPYHQYQLDSEVQDVPTEVSYVSPGEISMITILDDLRNQLDGHLKVNQEQNIVNDSLRAELARCKLEIQNLERNKSLYSSEGLSREQVYWLPAKELATQKSDPPKPVTPFVHTRPTPSKVQLQGKDDTIRKLKTQINSMSILNVEPTVGSFDKQALKTDLTQLKDVITSVRIQNDGFKVKNVNPKRRYQELSTSNSHSRDTLTRKLTALTTENAKLKSESLSKMHSEPIIHEKPKVLDPDMYPIRVKPTNEASKPMSKSDTQNRSTLPAKHETTRKVEDHHRNWNKQNHVDSRLNVKPKHNVKTNKKVWKAKVVTIRSQWKPTGRRFTLYDEYPLTRIVEPIVEPLELTPCVSSNSKVTMISMFTDYKLSNRKAGSKGIFGSLNCPLEFGFRMLSAYDGDRLKFTNYVDKFIGTVRF
nr:hypothetical protein [Tanacetum cinerariifolium]